MTNLQPSPTQPEQFVLTIGDIGVSPSWIVTPNGTAPLSGSQWMAQDRSFTTKTTPTWAIVLAIVFAAACLLGLLFLLAKENATSGYTEVTVRSGNLFHVVQLPASSPQHVAHARQLVFQAQSMAASAS